MKISVLPNGHHPRPSMKVPNVIVWNNRAVELREIRQDVIPAPAGSAKIAPMIVVRRLAAYDDQPIDSSRGAAPTITKSASHGAMRNPQVS
jgi:hypothetical protein